MKFFVKKTGFLQKKSQKSSILTIQPPGYCFIQNVEKMMTSFMNGPNRSIKSNKIKKRGRTESRGMFSCSDTSILLALVSNFCSYFHEVSFSALLFIMTCFLLKTSIVHQPKSISEQLISQYKIDLMKIFQKYAKNASTCLSQHRELKLKFCLLFLDIFDRTKLLSRYMSAFRITTTSRYITPACFVRNCSNISSQFSSYIGQVHFENFLCYQRKVWDNDW